MSLYDQSIFRAYDMRGVYPTQMNEEVAYAVGQAFVKVMGAKRVVVGRDVRSSGVTIQDSLIQGVLDAGADVIEVGVISTEMLYFAAGSLECDGGMSITASHNPPQWNGVKFIGRGAVPLTKDDKLGEIYDFVNKHTKLSEFTKGKLEHRDLLADYIELLSKFLPTDLPPLKLVANTNFGANGPIVDALLAKLPSVEVVRLNWERDGSFPKGTPDPLLPSNRAELCEMIKTENAQAGVAWDADADRVFFYDEQGRFFHGYYITSLLIRHFLAKEQGATIVGERRLVWANQDAVNEMGGKLEFSRTGHGYIKAAMREHNAIFAGEVSGHYYFRDFFTCDNGLVTFLIVLAAFGKEIAAGRKVSALLDSFLSKYPISIQEMNYITPDAAKIIEAIGEKYSEAEQNHIDGLSLDMPTWHANIRSSSNEPVMRLNIEAKTQDELENRKKEIMDFIQSFGAELRNDE